MSFKPQGVDPIPETTCAGYLDHPFKNPGFSAE